MSKLKDVSDKIERLEATESRCGVELNALSAYQNSDNVFVQGDLQLVQGVSLKSDLEVLAVVYDENARVIGKEGMSFDRDEYYACSSFQVHLRTPKKMVGRIRVHIRKT